MRQSHSKPAASPAFSLTMDSANHPPPKTVRFATNKVQHAPVAPPASARPARPLRHHEPAPPPPPNKYLLSLPSVLPPASSTVDPSVEDSISEVSPSSRLSPSGLGSPTAREAFYAKVRLTGRGTGGFDLASMRRMHNTLHEMQDVCSRVGLDASLLLADLETVDTAARRPSVALAALEITNRNPDGDGGEGAPSPADNEVDWEQESSQAPADDELLPKKHPKGQSRTVNALQELQNAFQKQLDVHVRHAVHASNGTPSSSSRSAGAAVVLDKKGDLGVASLDVDTTEQSTTDMERHIAAAQEQLEEAVQLLKPSIAQTVLGRTAPSDPELPSRLMLVFSSLRTACKSAALELQNSSSLLRESRREAQRRRSAALKSIPSPRGLPTQPLSLVPPPAGGSTTVSGGSQVPSLENSRTAEAKVVLSPTAPHAVQVTSTTPAVTAAPPPKVSSELLVMVSLDSPALLDYFASTEVAAVVRSLLRYTLLQVAQHTETGTLALFDGDWDLFEYQQKQQAATSRVTTTDPQEQSPSAGNSFLFSFQSELEALSFAEAVQQYVQRLPWAQVVRERLEEGESFPALLQPIFLPDPPMSDRKEGHATTTTTERSGVEAKAHASQMTTKPPNPLKQRLQLSATLWDTYEPVPWGASDDDDTIFVEAQWVHAYQRMEGYFQSALRDAESKFVESNAHRTLFPGIMVAHNNTTDEAILEDVASVPQVVSEKTALHRGGPLLRVAMHAVPPPPSSIAATNPRSSMVQALQWSAHALRVLSSVTETLVGGETGLTLAAYEQCKNALRLRDARVRLVDNGLMVNAAHLTHHAQSVTAAHQQLHRDEQECHFSVEWTTSRGVVCLRSCGVVNGTPVAVGVVAASAGGPQGSVARRQTTTTGSGGVWWALPILQSFAQTPLHPSTVGQQSSCGTQSDGSSFGAPESSFRATRRRSSVRRARLSLDGVVAGMPGEAVQSNVVVSPPPPPAIPGIPVVSGGDEATPPHRTGSARRTSTATHWITDSPPPPLMTLPSQRSLSKMSKKQSNRLMRPDGPFTSSSRPTTAASLSLPGWAEGNKSLSQLMKPQDTRELGVQTMDAAENPTRGVTRIALQSVSRLQRWLDGSYPDEDLLKDLYQELDAAVPVMGSKKHWKLLAGGVSSPLRNGQQSVSDFMWSELQLLTEDLLSRYRGKYFGEDRTATRAALVAHYLAVRQSLQLGGGRGGIGATSSSAGGNINNNHSFPGLVLSPHAISASTPRSANTPTRVGGGTPRHANGTPNRSAGIVAGLLNS